MEPLNRMVSKNMVDDLYNDIIVIRRTHLSNIKIFRYVF